jgi:hypothetical protein
MYRDRQATYVLFLTGGFDTAPAVGAGVRRVATQPSGWNKKEFP